MRELHPEHLSQAHAELRAHDWPDTVEETLQGPHASALRLAAWRLSRGQRLVVPPPLQRPPVVAPVPPLLPPAPRPPERRPPPRPPPATPAPSSAPRFDPKRAAAADWDE